jgi:HTH-type transcriptional regulator/antitoxin HigA
MEIKSIKSDQEYNDSIRRIDELWGSLPGTAEGDELDLLCSLVESYEITHYPIAPPELNDQQ